jgi:hypothetical protein
MSRPIAWAGLVVLVGINLLILAFLAAEVFQSLGPAPLIINSSSDMARAFELYQAKSDGLQKLVAALLGISSLYALALGFTTYLNARQYLENLKAEADRVKNDATDIIVRAEATNKKADKQAARLERQFPTFNRVEKAIEQMSGRLAALLPDTEWISQHYDRMGPLDHEEVLHYERSIASFEFLRSPRDEASRELYLRLSKYYRARHAAETRGKTWGPAAPSLDRAEFYLNKYSGEGDDYVALTERAIIAYKRSHEADSDAAAALFGLSISREPGQQRARYWLSVLLHRKGLFEEAEKTLTEALAQTRWERTVNPDRLVDIHYNRACARSRIAEMTADPAQQSAIAIESIKDLEKASEKPDLDTLQIMETDPDLAYAKTRFPAEYELVRKRLQGNQTTPNQTTPEN